MSTKPSTSTRRKPLLIAATLVFVALAIVYVVWWLIFASHFEDTDNAYVHGNLIQVTSQIPGTVVSIGADEIDQVKQGQKLVTLDASDSNIALQQAQAALAQSVRQTQTIFVQNKALEADISARQADIERAQADLAKADSDLKRRQTLARSGGVSGEEILHAQTAVKAAQSGLAQAKAALAVSRAKLETNQSLTANTTVPHHPDVLLAADKLRQAWLAASRTQILAPVDGMVAQRSVQVGQHVSPGTPLITLVPLKQLWVEANFKEGQLQRMKPGQRATLVADIYGGDVTYHGWVQGLAAGTGAAFSLLPAQNASGNWIKVVQRVPVRIVLDPKELAAHPLRVGLSLQVKVDLTDPKDEDVRKAQQPVDAKGLSTPVFDRDNEKVDAMVAQIIKENSGD